MKKGLKKPKRKIAVAESSQIRKLASYGLTNKEIAEALGYDENTFKRHFEIFLTKGRAELKEKLRRKQIQVAMNGNVTMLIWLGKQYLGQAEKVQETGDYKITFERVVVDHRTAEKIDIPSQAE